MKWNLEIAASAQREMRKLPEDIIIRINQKILELIENPFPDDVRKLKDRTGYRLRVGVWRILYEVYKRERRIVIFAVGHRREIYKI